MEHLNFGNSFKHLFCPSRKEYSVLTSLLTSDISTPNENMSEVQDGGWPRAVSGALCLHIFQYSSCWRGSSNFRFDRDRNGIMA